MGSSGGDLIPNCTLKGTSGATAGQLCSGTRHALGGEQTPASVFPELSPISRHPSAWDAAAHPPVHLIGGWDCCGQQDEMKVSPGKPAAR